MDLEYSCQFTDLFLAPTGAQEVALSVSLSVIFSQLSLSSLSVVDSKS